MHIRMKKLIFVARVRACAVFKFWFVPGVDYFVKPFGVPFAILYSPLHICNAIYSTHLNAY